MSGYIIGGGRVLTEAQAAREAREQALRDEANERARAIYLADLAAREAEKAAAADARIDAALAPERVRLEREWLADHPEATAADFAARAWPHLRANLLETRVRAEHERLADASGLYTAF